ncbi:MAG: hypoxanthine phosphoribosyltransferase [Crocinitomicaceae bacterium]
MQTIKVKEKRFEIAIPANRIAQRVDELQAEIYLNYQDRTPIFIGILNGSFIFMADLLKGYPGDCEMDFIKASSYEGMESTGNVKEIMGLKTDIEGRDIVLVEDIVDTGLTLQKLLENLKRSKPSSISIVSLLFKPEKCQADFTIDYLGFEIPNEFVIGYGLDFDGSVRNLKHIYRLQES